MERQACQRKSFGTDRQTSERNLLSHECVHMVMARRPVRNERRSAANSVANAAKAHKPNTVDTRRLDARWLPHAGLSLPRLVACQRRLDVPQRRSTIARHARSFRWSQAFLLIHCRSGACSCFYVATAPLASSNPCIYLPHIDARGCASATQLCTTSVLVQPGSACLQIQIQIA